MTHHRMTHEEMLARDKSQRITHIKNTIINYVLVVLFVGALSYSGVLLVVYLVRDVLGL